jgi:hypothetical protein
MGYELHMQSEGKTGDKDISYIFGLADDES